MEPLVKISEIVETLFEQNSDVLYVLGKYSSRSFFIIAQVSLFSVCKKTVGKVH